jgi:hypothetical protein
VGCFGRNPRRADAGNYQDHLRPSSAAGCIWALSGKVKPSSFGDVQAHQARTDFRLDTLRRGGSPLDGRRRRRRSLVMNLEVPEWLYEPINKFEPLQASR